MNSLQKLLNNKKENLLSVYYTAGYPKLEDTAVICTALQDSGADIVEIGIPFSDPVADGETIQASNQKALDNGMTLKKLFSQLELLKDKVSIPIILMGYVNPVLQYGLEEFCKKCSELGVAGTIIPDLPIELYLDKYASLYKENNLSNIFLITPQTADERIKFIDQNTDSFIYAVSSAAVTGGKIALDSRTEYLQRIKDLRLKSPVLVGFGVSTSEDLKHIYKYANGAIIGSAFIRAFSASISRPASEITREFISALVS